MNVDSISSGSLFSSEKTFGLGQDRKNIADTFGKNIQDSIDAIDKMQKSAEKEVSRAVTGESPDLHKTIIALQTADLKFQFGLQVRNKLVGAYEEVMRMQV